MDATFQLNESVFNYRVAAIMLEDKHVLIHKQIHDEHWALPGGRVKVLEDSHTSMKREIIEELGVDIKVERLLWVTENFFEYAQKDFHEIGLYYKVSSNDGHFQLRKNSFYGLEGERLLYKWAPLNELHTIPLYPKFLISGLQNMPTSPEHLILKTE